jgi:hypothetical protein
MNADTYNTSRRILFCIANNPKKGFSLAYECLEEIYRSKLGNKGYIGLKAELKFYEQYKKKFGLTVAGDMGEHADFAGIHENKNSRFDVTTNLEFKKFETYEPFLDDGPIYKVVLLDPKSFQVSDIVTLSFERCDCGGYKIPFILLKGENFNAHGESQWSNDQIQMKICSVCSTFDEVHRHTHHFLYSPSEFFNGLPEELESETKSEAMINYAIDAYKYFRREFSDDLMAVAEHTYKITDRAGDGFWTFNFLMKNQVIAKEIPEDVNCGLL